MRDRNGTIGSNGNGFADSGAESVKCTNRLNGILRTIRNVHRLMAREKSAGILVQGICRELIRTGDYSSAWIVRLDDRLRMVSARAAGIGKPFSGFVQKMRRGEWPSCIRQTLKQKRLPAVGNTEDLCTDCPISKSCNAAWMRVLLLRHDKTTYGVLGVSTGEEPLTDSRENEILEDLADDIAFALHRIESDNEPKYTENVHPDHVPLFSTLIHSLPGMAYRCRNNRERTFAFVSEGCRTLTGYRPDNFVGNGKRSFFDLIHPDDSARVRDRLRRSLSRHRPFELFYRILTASGEEKWVLEQGRGVFDGKNPISVEGFVTDVTAVKQTEEKLKRTEQKLEKTTADLKRSRDDLNQFFHIASHDLQESLRMVASHVQLMKKRYVSQMDPSIRCFMDFALEGALRIQRQISDYLDYLRLDRTGKPFEQIDLSQTMDRVLKRLQPEIERTGADVSIDPLPILSADAVQMTQLFHELIENAIKFRGEHVPSVHIHSEENNGAWTFSVHDNGIGIAPQYQERIFKVFQRLHDRQKYSGTGIGLAMCKKIVERHGGNMWVDSAPRQGTTFFFTVSRLAN